MIARAALAVIALAVLDDAFMHREPGTSIADHLASGLVPAAVALALAVVYPGRRPGVRALIALVCGSLAIVAGIVDGLRHILIDRVAGDDLTAVLALVAGAILIMLGTAVLWTSRRRDEPLRRRYGRRALITIAALVSAYFVVLPVAIAIVVNHKARAPMRRA